jgi:hypothetical protein
LLCYTEQNIQMKNLWQLGKLHISAETQYHEGNYLCYWCWQRSPYIQPLYGGHNIYSNRNPWQIWTLNCVSTNQHIKIRANVWSQTPVHLKSTELKLSQQTEVNDLKMTFDYISVKSKSHQSGKQKNNMATLLQHCLPLWRTKTKISKQFIWQKTSITQRNA